MEEIEELVEIEEKLRNRNGRKEEKKKRGLARNIQQT